ncbi:PhoP/PhoQ regulator MgrB [Morganella psychrotolerans]|nr:PhoP/PhoQ regulator MgrB [Morganella psychrotolerans]
MCFFYIAALDKYCDQREDFMLGICEITKFIPSEKG